MIRAREQSNPIEHRQSASTPVSGRHAREEQGHLHVLDGGELRQEMMKLKDESDLAIPERHARLVVHPVDRVFANPDFARIDRVEPAEHVKERALPDARRADNREHLAACDAEVEPAQHLEAAPWRLVRLRQAAYVHEGGWFGH